MRHSMSKDTALKRRNSSTPYISLQRLAMFAPWRSQNPLRKTWVSDYWKIIHRTETGTQNRTKQEKPKTTSGTKTEKPLVFFRKTENQMLKNKKSANRNDHQNQKTEVFCNKNQKTDLKNSQNRKTENPNAPLL